MARVRRERTRKILKRKSPVKRTKRTTARKPSPKGRNLQYRAVAVYNECMREETERERRAHPRDPPMVRFNRARERCRKRIKDLGLPSI